MINEWRMEGMKKAYGITPASFTIWHPDESFNEKGMERYIAWMLDGGAQSLSFCGSTGENITMSMEEQKAILEKCIGFVDGAVPVYAGTGRYSTQQTIELSRHAEACGADGVMTILPYYLQPHKQAVMNHFRALRQQIGIDIMVYNNPWFAGYELTPEEVAELYRENVVQSIKAAHGDPAKVTQMKMATDAGFTVFYGHDYAGMEAYWGGADGWLSAWPALFPAHCRAVQDAVIVERNHEKAYALVKQYLPIRNLFLNDHAAGVPHWQEKGKYILKALGLDFAGTPRKPLGELTPEYKKKIEKTLSECL
jgi:4-hydroxy-tetrahydrodipicolinate synthase